MAHFPLPSPPWSDWLVVYFVVIGLASGVTLVGALLDVERSPKVSVVELFATYVSLLALAVAGAMLVYDLGRPARFWLMLAGLPNLRSPMAWGARLLALKAGLLLGYAYLLKSCLARDGAAPAAGTPTLGILLAVTRWSLQGASLALAIYPAFLLSRTWGSPLAGTPSSALLFLLSALLLGVAAWLLLARLVPELRIKEQLLRAMNLLLILEFATLAFQWLLLRGDARGRSLLRALETPAALACLIGIGTSFMLPAVSRLMPARWRSTPALNAVAIAVGAASVRYLLFAGR